MAGSNALARILLIFIAVRVAPAFSSSSWYCHRLVPQFITSYVTPCTFPCLVLSRHEHPKIIVQNEPDGTPCHIPDGLQKEGKIGKCQRSVCGPTESYKILKRKRRIFCLTSLAKLFKLRKQRKALQQKISQLMEQLARSGYPDVGEDGGSSPSRRRRMDAGGFPLYNAGNNIVGKSRVENMGVGGSGASNITFSESGSGTSAIGQAGGLGLPGRNTEGAGISGNVLRRPGADESEGFRGMNSNGMPMRVFGDVYRRSSGVGGFPLYNAGRNIVGRSRVENMGVGGSGASNIPFSESGSGTSAIGQAGGLGLPGRNTEGAGISGNTLRGPGADESVGFPGMNSNGMPMRVSGVVYRRSSGAGGFPLYNAGSNIVGRSRVENMGIGGSGASNIFISESGSGASAIGQAGGLGLPGNKSERVGISGNVLRGPDADESEGFRGINSNGMPMRVSGDVYRRSSGAGGFPLYNAGRNMVGRSRVENMGVGGSGASNIPFSESGSGTSAIGQAGGFGLPGRNTQVAGISGNVLRGPGADETEGFRGMNTNGMPMRVSGDVYSLNRQSGPFGFASSASARTIGMDATGVRGTGTNGGTFVLANGLSGEADIGGAAGFR